MKPEKEKGYQLEFGSRALLSLFLALALVCGLFFAFGYTMGKHAIPATFALGSTAAASAKPLAAPAPTGVQPPDVAALSAAEANQTPATLQPVQPPVTTPVATPPTAAASAPHAAPPSASHSALPSMSVTASGGSFKVQVFAGAKTDADSLAAALQTRGYPAVVAGPGPGETDIYRVQLGPYLTNEEAQATKSRLTADGYQAIVKPQ